MARKNIESILKQIHLAELFAEQDIFAKFWVNFPSSKWPRYYPDEVLGLFSQELIYSLIIDELDETITHENDIILMRWRSLSTENQKTYEDFVGRLNNLDKLSEEKDFKVVEHLKSYKLFDYSTSKTISKLSLWFIITVSFSLVFSFVYDFLV